MWTQLTHKFVGINRFQCLDLIFLFFVVICHGWLWDVSHSRHEGPHTCTTELDPTELNESHGLFAMFPLVQPRCQEAWTSLTGEETKVWCRQQWLTMVRRLWFDRPHAPIKELYIDWSTRACLWRLLPSSYGGRHFAVLGFLVGKAYREAGTALNLVTEVRR